MLRGYAHCHCKLPLADSSFSGRTLCKPIVSRKLLNIWKYKSWLIVRPCRTNPWTIRPVTKPWTQWLRWLIVREYMHIRTYIYIHILYNALCGPGSSVGIAGWRFRDRIPVGTRMFDRPDRSWAHLASFKMGTGSFPGVKCGRGVLLTTHPLLVPR